MEKVIQAPPIYKLLEKKHNDKWVAFSIDYKKIVDYSKSLEELQKKVGNANVVYHKAYPVDVIIAPFS
jgi:hypothetical protein